MPESGAIAATTVAPRQGPSAPGRAEPDAPLVRRPERGEEISVPATRLWVGSATGTANRNPAREADRVAVELAAFSIDALPYPNDPARPARGGASRAEAEQLCAEQGKRLCSELEWEHACKGQRDAEHPSALGFDAPRCAQDALNCSSDLGVFALGTLGREWTGSPARDGDWDRLRTAIVRGADANASAALHRCAARDAAAPESKSEHLFFRCCRGALQTSEYPREAAHPAFRALELDRDGAREKLRAMPETRAFATSFSLQAQSSMLAALGAAGRSSQSLSPWQAATPAFAWSPLPGEEVTVLSGDSPAGAALVAFYPTADGPRFAGSFVTKDEHTPILVAYKSDTRDELLFSTCWGCGGEGGALRLDPSQRLRFMPR
jgi:hypothetical protein